jgi:hypothetical protein
MGLWDRHKEDYTGYARTSAFVLILISMLVGQDLGEIALVISKRSGKWTSGNIWWMFILVFWYFNSVSELGYAEGKRDSHPDQTQLNIVEKTDRETLWLLFSRDELLYAAILQKGDNPKIAILSREDVRYIYKQPNNKISKDSKPSDPNQSDQ